MTGRTYSKDQHGANGAPRASAGAEAGHATNSNKGNVSAAPPQAMNPLWKTKPCSFYNSHGCRHGRLCTFAHGDEEMRTTPDFTRTAICPELLKTGRCTTAADCPYAHNRTELRPAPGLMKTRMCDFFKKGICIADGLCRFAHQESELSPAASAFFEGSGIRPGVLEAEAALATKTIINEEVPPVPVANPGQQRRVVDPVQNRRERNLPSNQNGYHVVQALAKVELVDPGFAQTAKDSDELGLMVLQELQARVNTMSDTFTMPQQQPSYDMVRRQLEENALNEDTINMLQQWNNLPPESRARLLENVSGKGLGRGKQPTGGMNQPMGPGKTSGVVTRASRRTRRQGKQGSGGTEAPLMPAGPVMPPPLPNFVRQMPEARCGTAGVMPHQGPAPVNDFGDQIVQLNRLWNDIQSKHTGKASLHEARACAERLTEQLRLMSDQALVREDFGRSFQGQFVEAASL